MQRKLAIGATDDPLEQEADRVAEHVLAGPACPSVRASPPRIQCFGRQLKGDTDAAPASVDRALAHSGQPLAPDLQQEMGRRFSYDFSQVRIHSGAQAEQSARDVNAQAYTVGQNLVFGAGRFAPETQPGRRLIAHELTHVVQQSGQANLIQRAPANFPKSERTPPTGPDSSAQTPGPTPTPDQWIGWLENFRRQSPQEFSKTLMANERIIYPLLQPYGFHGSWINDQEYLADFDAAVAKWGKAQAYIRAFKVAQTAPQPTSKSREEQRYENAQYLVRDMNRHGYTRGQINDELDSSGLMDDLVSHGFEIHGKWSFKNHEVYTNEAIVALNAYIDRYDAAHGNKRQTSANVPSEGENVEFYRAWLEGMNYVTSSFFAAAFANTASKFTSDPKKITEAAELGATFDGAILSVAGALGASGSYRPEVVGPRDRPAAVGPWRYTGKQPIKPVINPENVGTPTPGPVRSTPVETVPRNRSMSPPQSEDIVASSPQPEGPSAGGMVPPEEKPSSQTPARSNSTQSSSNPPTPPTTTGERSSESSGQTGPTGTRHLPREFKMPTSNGSSFPETSEQVGTPAQRSQGRVRARGERVGPGEVGTKTTDVPGGRSGTREHWHEHGHEFPEYANARQYKEGAVEFCRAPTTRRFYYRHNGRPTIGYYNPATNTFAATSVDGSTIFTYFRPADVTGYVRNIRQGDVPPGTTPRHSTPVRKN